MTPRSLSLIAVLALAFADSAGARERWLFKKRPAPVVVCQSAPRIAVAPAPVEKTYTVDFDKAKWADVFAWLAKEAKLVYLSTESPTGTLSLKSDGQFTLPELFDLLDEVLEQKNSTLIRREHSFLVHPADEKIPREILHQITLEELKLRGKREIVQVVIPLKNLIADDVAPQAKKLLSRFGDVTAFGTNQLIVVDRVKNIRNILSFVNEQPDRGSDQITYICKHVRARVAARKLATLLGDIKTKVESNVPLPEGIAAPANSEKRYATVQITVDDATNTIIVTGPSSKLVAAQALLREIDQGPKLRPTGEPLWKTYEVPANAEATAKRIMASVEFKGSNVKTLVIGDSKVMVYGTPADHADIGELLNPPPVVAAVPECEPRCICPPAQPRWRLFARLTSTPRSARRRRASGAGGRRGP